MKRPHKLLSYACDTGSVAINDQYVIHSSDAWAGIINGLIQVTDILPSNYPDELMEATRKIFLYQLEQELILSGQMCMDTVEQLGYYCTCAWVKYAYIDDCGEADCYLDIDTFFEHTAPIEE